MQDLIGSGGDRCFVCGCLGQQRSRGRQSRRALSLDKYRQRDQNERQQCRCRRWSEPEIPISKLLPESYCGSSEGPTFGRRDRFLIIETRSLWLCVSEL